MKRKFLAAALAFTMCLTPCTSFAAEETTEAADGASVTAEELFKKQAEYSQSVNSMSADMDINFDFSLLMSQADEAGETQDYGTGIKMIGDLKVDAMLNPMKMAMTGTMDMEIDTQKESIDFNTYMVASEDGTKLDVYTENPEAQGEWLHTVTDMTETLKMFNVSSIDELQTVNDMSMFGDDVDWAVTETDSTYDISGQIKFGSMSDLVLPIVEESMQSSMAASGQEIDMATIEPIITMILDCFVVNVSYTMDKETCAAQTIHMDFNDSDLSVITGLIKSSLAAAGMSGDGFDVSMNLNDFSIDATYSYDTVSEITVPEEALNAETIDMNELMSESVDEAAEVVE